MGSRCSSKAFPVAHRGTAGQHHRPLLGNELLQGPCQGGLAAGTQQRQRLIKPLLRRAFGLEPTALQFQTCGGWGARSEGAGARLQPPPRLPGGPGAEKRLL